MRRIRFVGGAVVILAFVATIASLARRTAAAPWTPGGISIAVLGAIAVILALGSLYEWLVHRFIYHGPSRIGLFQSIHEIHQRGHHWHRFPPDRYVQDGPIERIPVFPGDPYALCGSQQKRRLAWAGQYALYMSVGIPLAFAPAWLWSHNLLFTVSCIIAGVTVCYFFIQVHDVIHYPGQRWMERRSLFRFLDRHHYIHHIDNRANINFLLPLCDWLFGTLKLELSPVEASRWPTFEQAKRVEAGASSVADSAAGLRHPDYSS
jgi:hypothetical protein